VLAVKFWVVGPYKISSSWMEPTFHCGKGAPGCTARFSDRVLANRFIYHFRKPHRGEIVVLDAPRRAQRMCGVGGTLVARIVGLPGERVAERRGRMLVDGKPLDEPYVSTPAAAGETGRWGPLRTSAYFVMGDNRAAACDSRRWGPVAREDLIGPVFFVYWPPTRIGFR
jgi:signal peptidase I